MRKAPLATLLLRQMPAPVNLTGAATRKPADPDLDFVDTGFASIRLVPNGRLLGTWLLDPSLERDQAPLK
jgi:hypothetical protein